ncbi:MAG: tRNA lysidine(34) synthetase TilS [Fluviicola sp.]
MVDLPQHIDAVLQKYNPGEIIVACSAGLDSTVLFHACLKLKYPVAIAHVNYQLRGKASDLDQEFLENLASAHNISIHIKRINLEEKLKDKGNLQELARNERYQFFESLISKSKNTFVLLAHHKEDQTETFFMNLARNSGIMGLAAMPERRGSYLRPLLSFSKEDLKNFAINEDISWREDASNQSLKYTRNEWRNIVLPEIRKEIPTLDDSVRLLTQIFQEKQLTLQTKINDIVLDIQNTSSLSVATFHALDEWEQVELCRQLGQPIGILKKWRSLNHKGTGIPLLAKKDYPFVGHQILFDGDSYSFIDNSKDKKVSFRKMKVATLPKIFDKQAIYLDESLIFGTLRFREVQTGDRIHPIGMKGSRLVSDVISDAKLTGLQKHNLQVLIDDQHVLWVPGLCVSRKAIASSESFEILKLYLD